MFPVPQWRVFIVLAFISSLDRTLSSGAHPMPCTLESSNDIYLLHYDCAVLFVLKLWCLIEGFWCTLQLLASDLTSCYLLVPSSESFNSALQCTLSSISLCFLSRNSCTSFHGPVPYIFHGLVPYIFHGPVPYKDEMHASDVEICETISNSFIFSISVHV